MDIEVTKSGPVFDGRADRAYQDFLHKADDEISAAGVDMVKRNLNEVIRVNHHVYVSHIHGRPAGSLNHVIEDGGSVYGPWLEGTGSRNRTTRFKGYFTFRRTVQELQSKAGDIAERVLQRYIGRMD